MSDFTTGKKISLTVFLEHLIYSLMALTWHCIEGKDLLPNLRLHAKEAVKQARGAREEGARYFRRKGRIRCRETLTWVSLASQPRGPWVAWTRPHCSPCPSSFPAAPKPLASHPGPGHGGGGSIIWPSWDRAILRPFHTLHGPDVGNVNVVCIFIGVCLRHGALVVWENPEPSQEVCFGLCSEPLHDSGFFSGESRRWRCDRRTVMVFPLEKPRLWSKSQGRGGVYPQITT